MKKLIFWTVAVLTWTACGNKTGGGTTDADSTQVFEVPDTLNSVEAVIKQVDAVYDYLDEMHQHYTEGMPSLDERFATRSGCRHSRKLRLLTKTVSAVASLTSVMKDRSIHGPMTAMRVVSVLTVSVLNCCPTEQLMSGSL